jgi:hypothetical protein
MRLDAWQLSPSPSGHAQTSLLTEAALGYFAAPAGESSASSRFRRREIVRRAGGWRPLCVPARARPGFGTFECMSQGFALDRCGESPDGLRRASRSTLNALGWLASRTWRASSSERPSSVAHGSTSHPRASLACQSHVRNGRRASVAPNTQYQHAVVSHIGSIFLRDQPFFELNRPSSPDAYRPP